MRKITVLLLFTVIPSLLLTFNNCSQYTPTSANTKRNSDTVRDINGDFSDDPDGNETFDPNNSTGTKIEDPLPGNETPSEEFLRLGVRPTLETSCKSCHTSPRFNPELPGPLTIYNHKIMRAFLLEGISPTNNSLINKVQNLVGHSGGNQCPGGPNTSPCREIIAWREFEVPGESSGPTGAISNISILGKINGFAIDPKNTGKKLTVMIYGGGPVGQGQLLATLVADLFGFGLGDGHTFSFDLPAPFRDGTAQQLYVYADSATAESLLPGMPYNYAAYSYSQTGRDFYKQNLANTFSNSCGSCHGSAYEDRFPALLFPSPFNGGTARNNSLINYANGENQHTGGSFCGGNKNSGVCAQIRQWWNAENN